MFVLIVLICTTGQPCDPMKAERAYEGAPVPLHQCQVQAIPILNALPDLPDGQVYAAACAGENYRGKKV